MICELLFFDPIAVHISFWFDNFTVTGYVFEFFSYVNFWKYLITFYYIFDPIKQNLKQYKILQKIVGIFLIRLSNQALDYKSRTLDL